MPEPNITIKKSPAMSQEELDEATIAFIQVWSAMIDWNEHKAFVVVDIENVYFVLYSLRDDKLVNCYIGNLVDGLWYMEKNREVTWDRIRNIIGLLGLKESIDVGGKW